MPDFSTFPLDAGRLVEALPLVRMAVPGIDEARWLAHCYSMVRLGGGVLAAAAPDGALHGIASWRPEVDLRLGRVLRVETMVALELGAANPVRAALCEALETLCADEDAVGVALSVPIRGEHLPSSFAESWQRAGFRRQALFVCKPVPRARPAATPGSRLRFVD